MTAWIRRRQAPAHRQFPPRHHDARNGRADDAPTWRISPARCMAARSSICSIVSPFSCASRFSQRYAVTLSVDQVVFRQPIHVANSSPSRRDHYAGRRTSMEVGIRVEAENIRSGARRHTNSCYFTMVAVDEEGKPRRKCRPMCRNRSCRTPPARPPKPAANCAANSNNASTRPRRKGRRAESPLTHPQSRPPDRRIQGHGRKAHHSVIPAPEPDPADMRLHVEKPLPPSGLG